MMWPRLFIFQLSTNLLTASENGSYITYVSRSPFGGKLPPCSLPGWNLERVYTQRGQVSYHYPVPYHYIAELFPCYSDVVTWNWTTLSIIPVHLVSVLLRPATLIRIHTWSFHTEVLFFNTCVLISLDLYNIYRSQTTRFLFTWQFSWTNFRMFHCAKYSKPFYLRQCFSKLTTTSLAICPSRVFGTHAHERCYHRNHRSSVSTSQSLGNNR